MRQGDGHPDEAVVDGDGADGVARDPDVTGLSALQGAQDSGEVPGLSLLSLQQADGHVKLLLQQLVTHRREGDTGWDVKLLLQQLVTHRREGDTG